MNKFFKNILNASLEDWAIVTDKTLVTPKSSKVLNKSITGAVFIAAAVLTTPVFAAEGNAGGEIAGKGSTAISECGSSSPYDGTLEPGEAHAGATYSIAIGCNTDVGSQNSVAIGGGPTPETGAKIGTNSNNSVVLGQGDIGNDSANTSIIGSGTVGENSANASILGKGSVGTESANSSIIGSGIIGNNSSNSSILGRGTVGNNSSDANVLGLGTIGDNAQNASILGKGEVGSNSKNASIIGAGIIGENSANASVLGQGQIGNNSINANVLGAGTIGDASSNASVIGTGTVGNNSKNSISIGTNNKINGQNIYVLGSEIDVAIENSVILGNASTLDKVYLKDEIQKIEGGKIDLDSFQFAGTQLTNQAGAVSVGSAGQERQIQHVGAGRITATSTDAVNGSQLYYVLGAAKLPIYLNDGQGGLAELQLGDTFNIDGAKITVDANGNPILSIPKGTTKVVASKNMDVQSEEDADGNITYKVATKDDVDFNNVNINNKLTAGNVVVDAATNDIKGLSNTKIGKDAAPDFAKVGRGATEEQLNQTAGSVANIIGGNVTNNNGEVTGPFIVNDNPYDTIADAIGSESAAAKTKVDEGKNIKVDVKKGNNGEDIYTVSTQDDVDFNNVNLNNKLTAGNVVIDAKTNDIKGLANTGIGEKALPDFATVGRGATEEQLNQTAGSVANIIGGNVKNNNGELTGPFVVNNNTYDNIADAIGSESSAAKTKVDEGKNIKVDVTEGDDGESIYTVSTKDDVDFNNVNINNKLTVGKVVVDANTNDIKGLSNTVIGQNAAPDFAKAGRGATEEQLDQTAGSVANIIGGGVINNNGAVTGPFTVNGKEYANIADAIGSESSASKIGVDAGKNIKVDVTQDADGKTIYTVATKDDVEFSNVNVKDKLTAGNVVIDAATNDIKGLINTEIGDKALPDFATVGRGATEEQLNQSVGSVANIIGGGTTNNNGQITGPFTVNGKQYNNVADAIGSETSAAKTSVDAGKNMQVSVKQDSNGRDVYTVATQNDVDFNNVNINEKLTAGDVVIDANTNDIKGLSNKTIGTQAPPDFATVGRGATEEQLKLTAGSVANIIGGGVVNNNGEVTGPVTVHGNTYNTLVDAISANYTEVIGGNNINVTSSIGSSGQTIYNVATTDRPVFTEVNIGGKVTINNAGINMGNTQITNVAAGTEVHHAVNLGQLNTSITNVENKFNTRISGVEDRMSAGIAAAMAMEAAPYIAGKYTYAAGTAYHNNQTAFGVNLRKTADNGRWALTGGVAAGTEGDPSIRFGLSGVID